MIMINSELIKALESGSATPEQQANAAKFIIKAVRALELSLASLSGKPAEQRIAEAPLNPTRSS